MTSAPISDAVIRRLNTLQLMLAGVVIMAPEVWMVLSSFKPSFEVTAYPPTLVFSPTIENYSQLMKTTPFLAYTLNSIIVTTGSAGLGLSFGIPAAFAVSWTRISWPAILTLAARMAPGTLFLLPWYVMFRQVDLIGSYTALILSHAVITLPIVIWVLLPSFDNIPRSVFEAAQVDGCSVTRILWRIALPLVGSGIAVAAILAFVFSWNYFLFALVLSNGDTKTLIAAAFNFVGEGSTDWGALMAAATLIALPPLVLAMLVQRWLVAGLTLGAVKG
ncbi:MAG TPA: carbohydrate ABC transporter permease [Bradyrhizobium sp.]|uniref:carbohydrate ABC transporter permease n=1 Tax=Bradyrhizobium sp. TaxID=376 RepID=UPI002C66455D|nr:carbohydrate ABC transporter permease [Bradyrhizobium sp.]HLZ06149.1 carbohydrate ABC transporter permease [Bradyrhizobium sp.]